MPMRRRIRQSNKVEVCVVLPAECPVVFVFVLVLVTGSKPNKVVWVEVVELLRHAGPPPPGRVRVAISGAVASHWRMKPVMA